MSPDCDGVNGCVLETNFSLARRRVRDCAGECATHESGSWTKNGCERCGMDSGSAPTRLIESEFHSQQRATGCARSDSEPDELTPRTKSSGQSCAKGAGRCQPQTGL